MAGVYDVRLPALHQGARDVAADASAVAAARDDGSSAASDAAGPVNGGPLAAASHRLATSITSAGSGLSTALKGAGTTLTSNAGRYESDDATAGATFQATTFETGLWWSGGALRASTPPQQAFAGLAQRWMTQPPRWGPMERR